MKTSILKINEIAVVLLLISFGFLYVSSEYVFSEETETKEIKRTYLIGQRGEDVLDTQRLLNKTSCKVSTIGAGSVGQETTYLGNRTIRSLKCFQKQNGNIF